MPSSVIRYPVFIWSLSVIPFYSVICHLVLFCPLSSVVCHPVFFRPPDQPAQRLTEWSEQRTPLS